MAKTLTPRDQIERILDVLRRSTRYLWLIVAVTVVGGGLAIMFALSRPYQYESETVLLYREMISQSVLQGREVVQSANVLSSRYKEMLMARSNLVEVVKKFQLFPGVVEGEGEVAASDELRTRVSFRDKGAGTFRIAYKGDTPEEAQKVTQFLAERLKQEDSRLRREQADQTKVFLVGQKDTASTELRDRERKLAQFLIKHPEFAEEGSGSGAAGSAVRAAQKGKSSGGDPKLSALERQRRRIVARLKNPDAPPPPPREAQPEPGELREARRDVEAATRTLQERLGQLTEKHPDVVSARTQLAEAQQRLRRIESGLPAVPEVEAVLTGPVDRAALQRELDKVDREIAAYRATAGSTAAATRSQVADDVVSLETDWANLNRAVEEGRERVSTLEARVFTADITASSEIAEAAQLGVIDEAYLPPKPAGKPRKLLAIAGTAAFAGLGLALALGLALIDDRIYRRHDVDRVGFAPVLIVVPAERRGRSRA